MRAEDTSKFNLKVRSFQPKSKMDLFECNTANMAINNETCFTRSQYQEYYKSINNLHRVGNLISNSKLELKRVPSHDSQITEPPQVGKYSLKFVKLYCAE